MAGLHPINEHHKEAGTRPRVVGHAAWFPLHRDLTSGFDQVCAKRDGLENALAELGGVPQRHRTDALTATVPPGSDRPTLQRRYQALLGHYGLQGQAINSTKSHENGDVEVLQSTPP
jgi:hypothetical protein